MDWNLGMRLEHHPVISSEAGILPFLSPPVSCSDWDGWDGPLPPVFCLFCSHSEHDVSATAQHMKVLHL